MIDVVLIAPVRAYRDAVKHVLDGEPHLRLIAHGATAVDALASASRLCPAVLLMDLGVQDCFPAVRALRRLAPAMHLIAIGVPEDESVAHTVVVAAEAGIGGFVDADQPISDVVGAITLAVEGKAPCSARIAAILLRTLRSEVLPHSPARPSAGLGHHTSQVLTAREYEVAELVARGLTNRQIAVRLVVEPSTIKTHVHAILRKLDATERGEIGTTLFRH
jgi:two-component system, NarL family, nitrate/nitrite response regulator NarL